MENIIDFVFILDVITLFVMLIGVLWSVAMPSRRIWPPPKRRSWQFCLTWTCFILVFILNAAIIVLDWNSWIFRAPIRWVLGIPLIAIGALLVSWAISVLGTVNTSGIKGGFVSFGPYRYMRNPQYLGDCVLFIGLSIVTNSAYLWVTHLLLILVFIITPFAEEPWLEEQFGGAYLT